MNEHPDMQAKKLNAKYHLHVQHSTDARTQDPTRAQKCKSTRENAKHNLKVLSYISKGTN